MLDSGIGMLWRSWFTCAKN